MNGRRWQSAAVRLDDLTVPDTAVASRAYEVADSFCPPSSSGRRCSGVRSGVSVVVPTSLPLSAGRAIAHGALERMAANPLDAPVQT